MSQLAKSQTTVNVRQISTGTALTRENELMLTGELRSQIDAIWNSFRTGDISNQLEVMEQITYLLFLRRLDDLHALEENKALGLGKPSERRLFPEGQDAKGRAYNDLRWSRFKNFAPAEMYTVVGEHGRGTRLCLDLHGPGRH